MEIFELFVVEKITREIFELFVVEKITGEIFELFVVEKITGEIFELFVVEKITGEIFELFVVEKITGEIFEHGEEVDGRRGGEKLKETPYKVQPVHDCLFLQVESRLPNVMPLTTLLTQTVTRLLMSVGSPLALLMVASK